MEENNNVSLDIEQLLDVEELESKQAPSDQVMLPGGCHNHNETLLRKD